MRIPVIFIVNLYFISLLSPCLSLAETDPLRSALDTKIRTQETNAKSQKQIDHLAEQTRDLTREYRDAIHRTDTLTGYNKQLAKLIKQQRESLHSIQRQLDNIEETRRSIIPLMVKMIATLEKFVMLDLPFLKAERQQRVDSLKEIMDRADVSLPDKYRRIMEAYQIEMEYGRTIESYSDTIQIDQKEYTVEILRTGRLLMAFQTLDGKLTGHWDKEKKSWQTLPSEYRRSVSLGLQVAKKQAPPEFIKLPVDVTGK